MESSLELAERLRKALDAAGVKDAALAQACGVTRAAVSQWRRTGQIHKRHLETVARVTGKPVSWLLGGPDVSTEMARLLALWEALSPIEREKLLAEAAWLASRRPL